MQKIIQFVCKDNKNKNWKDFWNNNMDDPNYWNVDNLNQTSVKFKLNDKMRQKLEKYFFNKNNELWDLLGENWGWNDNYHTIKQK